MSLSLDKNKEILPLASSTWNQAEKDAAISIINSEKVLNFNETIEIKNISYEYPDSNKTPLKNISFTIKSDFRSIFKFTPYTL